MFKKTKIKQVMKRSLASLLAVATVFSGLVIPEKVEAFTSSPSDRRICYIDLGASDVKWNTSPSWIAAIDQYSGTKYTLVGHRSDYTGSTIVSWEYDYANNLLHNLASGEMDTEAMRKLGAPAANGIPLFYRSGYRFAGWDIYDESGNFLGGASNWNGAARGDYASATGNAQNKAFWESNSKYTFKAVWESVGYAAGDSAVSIKPVYSDSDVTDILDPVFRVEYTKKSGDYFISVGKGYAGDLVADSGASTKTTYTETIGKISSYDGKPYSAMDNNGQWQTKKFTDITISMNPNGGTAKFCGTNRTSSTTAYRLKETGTSVKLYPATKPGYTFTGYLCSNGSVIPNTQISSSGYTVSPTANVTYTAQYTKNASVTVSSVNTAYNGKANAVTVNGLPSGMSMSYQTSTDDGRTWSSWTSTTPSRINVGTTKVHWIASGDGYTETSGEASITINKAANPTTASGFNGNYDGQGHSVSFSNLPSGSTVTYTLDGTSNGTTKPVLTSVGSYTIGYTITNPNYETKSGSVSIVIKNRPNSATVTGYSGAYDGKSHSVSVSNVPSGVTVTYSVNGGAYTTTVPSRTNAGTDTIAWKATGTGFASKTGSVTLSIGKAAINVTAAGYTGTYDENSHTITLSGVPSGVSVNYTLDGVSKGTTKPSVTNAGTYTIGYSIQNANYESVSGSAKVIINKKENPATVTGYSGTYDRKSHTISVSGVPSGSTVAYEVDGKSVSSVSPRTNAGTTVVKYTITNPNYVTKEGTVSIVINKRTDMVAAGKDFTAFEDGKSYSIDTPVASGPDGGCKILYSTASDGAYSQDKPMFSKAGTYTVYWKATDPAGNYETKTGKNTVTIIKVYDYDATTGKLSLYNTTKEGLDIIYANTSAMGAKSIVVKEGVDAGQIDFDKFDYLEGVYIDGKNDAYSSRDGLLYSADGAVLKYCPKAYKEAEVVLPYSTTKVEPGVFSGRNNVERVLVKNPNCDITDAMGNVRVIAFKDSSVLTYCQDEGIAWDYIDEIGENFFKNEASITSFTVPDNITTIGRNAFSGCSSLKDVNLGQVETIGVGAFKNSGLTSAAIPSTVKTIDSEAFAYDQALEDVTFAENSQVKTIGKDAFIGCGLSEISIPNSVESVGAGAFKNTQLGTISIEGMNTELLWDANDVILPADAKIECYYGSKAYDFAKEHNYSILLKVGYDKDGVTSYSRDEDAVSLIESVSVGPNLTAIENSAFQNGSLENIVFDENSQVASIGSGAFAGTKLVDVTLPKATTSLGKAAFAGIDSLKSVSLGGVTDIPEQAFKGDSVLSTVTDSTKITSIGDEAFYHTNIGDADGVFYTGDKLKSIGMDAFSESAIQKLVVENPNAVFPDGKIVPDSATIQGYANSSADVYSQTYYNKSCESLGKPAYVITFDTVGGVGGTSSIYAVNGKELPSIETPSREDYVFNGYYASTNGGGTKYFDADGTPLVKWTNTSNTTLYASWKHETFNIAYDANNDIAEGTMDNDVVNTKSDYVLSKNAYTCDGYEFAGWALTKDAKTPKYADRENVRLSAKAGETVTLYAIWKPTFYTIKYNGNGGIDANSEMSDQTLKADKKGNLRENKFKKAGYTFLGWSEDSEAAVATWYDKEPVIHLADAGKTITLYAVWAKDNVKQYTITFDANGGSLDETTAPIYEGYETRIPDTGAKRDGFAFAGWSVVKASGKVDYRTGDMITADKDITLYAVWETKGDTGYKVRISTQKTNETYDVSERTMSANIGDVVTLTEGVDFIVPDGFYIDEASSVLSQTIAENTVFNITLNREKVSVAFDLNANDAVMRNVPVIKGLWGQRVTVVSEMPERAGYTFKGWSLGKEDTTPVTEVTLAVGGTTIYAIWVKEGNEESKPSVTPVPSETPSSSEVPSSSETPIATATPDSSSEPNPDATPAPTLTPDGSVIGEPTPTPSSAQEGDNSGNLGVATATATPDSSSEPNPDVTPAPTLTPDGSVIGEPTPTPSSAQEGDNSGNLGVATPLPNDSSSEPNSDATAPNSDMDKNVGTPLPNNGTNGTDGGTGYSVVGKVELTNTTPKTDNFSTATLGKVVYKISGKTAMVQKVSSKKVKAITIRNKVKIDGKTVKVTKINKNAFKGCKKLKKVTIQAKSLKSIGKNAFKGIAKKAVIKVPKAKKKAYKKLLKKAKIAKTIQVK